MDRLGALRLFLQAVEAGAITGAGQRLGLSSPPRSALCRSWRPHPVARLPQHRAHPAGYQAGIYAVHARGPAVPAETTAFVAHLRAALPPTQAE